MSTMQSSPHEFPGSRTCRNLLSACAGEMQARAQYLAAADRCEADDLHVVAHAFRFTAAQEKEHASVYRGLLRACGASPSEIPEAAPPELPAGTVDLLRTVTQTEHDEWDKLYPAYAAIAEEEGYPRIATTFRRIAETEHLHARRFIQFAEALASDTLFACRDRVGWLCLPCGHLHYGTQAPARCSTCGRSRGHFIRSDFHPFTVSP